MKGHGPGKVIDIDGKTVIVKHNGACIKVHAVSLEMKPQEVMMLIVQPPQ